MAHTTETTHAQHNTTHTQSYDWTVFFYPGRSGGRALLGQGGRGGNNPNEKLYT